MRVSSGDACKKGKGLDLDGAVARGVRNGVRLGIRAMTTFFVRNAERQWNSAGALERAYFAGEARKLFAGMRLDLSETIGKRFNELDNAIALRLAEYFWTSRGSR